MQSFCFRTGLHLTFNDTEYRVNKVLPDERVRLEQLDNGEMSAMAVRDLLSAFEKGELAITRRPKAARELTDNHISPDLQALPDKDQELIKHRLAYVRSAERKLGPKPVIKGLEEIIDQVSAQEAGAFTPSAATVYRWWRRYYMARGDILSLSSLLGSHTRKSKFDHSVLQEMEYMIEELYLTSEKWPAQTVYQNFKDKMEELNEVRAKPLALPSRACFYRRLEKLDKYDVCVAREGKRVANAKYRSSGSGPDVKHILERVEVDHTPLDVMVIDDKTHTTIGRPYLTLLLDYKSKMPLGIHIGFEPPSELSVMLALKQAILPKNWLKELYPDIESEWPAFGIPARLVCDNGMEFHSHQLRRVCMELNIELLFCPKQKPHYKGSVERHIGTANKSVCHLLPGTTRSNITERGDYSSADQALVTVGELTELIYQWTVEIYSKSLHRTLKTSPYNAWKDGLSRIEPMLPESADALTLIVCKEGTRKLSHKGIQLEHLFYNSDELGVWRSRSHADSFEVRFRYNVQDMSHIFVWDEKSHSYLKVPCTHLEYATGLTLRQHKQIHRSLTEQGHENIDEKQLRRARTRFYGKIQELKKEKRLTKRRQAERDAYDSNGKHISETNFASYPDDLLAETARPQVFDEPLKQVNLEVQEMPGGRS